MIGTRGSALALWQANCIRDCLLDKLPGLQIDLKVIRTKGDEVSQTALSRIGDTGLFTRQIDAALLAGSADLAVHSLKDLPTQLADGLALGAVPVREDPADALVAKDGLTLQRLPRGAKVLTGSLRRQAQLLHRRPDLVIAPVRGNIQTRLRKFDDSDAGAIVLARAALVRLELTDCITERLDPADFLPAPGQGALAIVHRADDARLADICRSLDDYESRTTTTAERAFLAALGGGCQMPIGAYATFAGRPAMLTVTGMVSNIVGSRVLRRTVSAPADASIDADALGRQLAEMLRADGCQEIFDEVLNHSSPAPEAAP
ncbi:MAG: hydroxymethylbilane synthase [Planctomycetia bacterium]|nr:hydroxymethylbilane synthase [Planctomycetia bacterium]